MDEASKAGEYADEMSRAHGGTHEYGYARDAGECVLKRQGCLGQSTTKCHDRFVCIPCLHLHKHDLDRDGVEMKFVGELPEVEAEAEAAMSDRDQLVKMLHEVWAVLVDRGGVSTHEFRDIADRAEAMLAEYGVEV